MGKNFYISREEKQYLRELAKKQLEYANLPSMEERTKLWYDHNSLKGERPPIVVEMFSFEGDMLPESQCTSPAARAIEKEINRWLVNHEKIDDDKVVPPYYSIGWRIHFKQFDMDIRMEHAVDSSGRNIGYTWENKIRNLKNDFSILKPSNYWVDREYTMAWKEFVEGIIGDILPIKIKNNSLQWHVAPSNKVVGLMGFENMMYAMVDTPKELHSLYQFIVDDMVAYIKWQQKEGLLTLNNENDFTGAGSYGFTTELPTAKYWDTKIVGPEDLWGNMNSQETISVSPDMYGDFVFPYYYELAEMFGLTYYGCCEPVHEVWDNYVSRLPNLRKVSISPWCKEEYMGERLQGGKVIYSRKPSPNYMGVGSLDEDSFREHIKKTLAAAKGCPLEFIFRDVYTVNGELGKPGRMVKIVRELTDELW